jgi:hypothetical protein
MTETGLVDGSLLSFFRELLKSFLKSAIESGELRKGLAVNRVYGL